MANKAQPNTLEAAFELPEDYLHGPAAGVLRPGLIEAVDRTTGQDRVLKIWWKTGTAADGEAKTIIQDIDGLVRELSDSAGTKSGNLILLFRPNQKMSDCIYLASNENISADDIQGQLNFIEADIASGGRLAVASRVDEVDRIFLLTETLSYCIQKYSDDTTSTWQIGTVVSIVARSEGRLPQNRELYAVRHSIKVVPNRNPRRFWKMP